jgi:exonuclease SbcD
VSILSEIGGFTLDTRSGPLQLVHVPWVTRTNLLAHEGMRDASMAEAQEYLRDIVSSQVQRQAARLDPAHPAVLLVHGTLHGASYGAERSALLGQDLVYTRSELSVDAFDYVALGHIHRHQEVGDHPPAVYPGSPERVDFGEEREDKGFVMVEISPGSRDGRVVTWAFRHLPVRRFATLQLRAAGSDPQGDVLRMIERSREVAGAVVRLLVTVAPEAEGQLRPPELRRALRTAGAHHIAAVRLDPEKPESRTRLQLDGQTQMTPLEMLALYLQAKHYPAMEARRLLALAESLMPEALGEIDLHDGLALDSSQRSAELSSVGEMEAGSVEPGRPSPVTAKP